MPVQLRNMLSKTVELTAESARRWLREAGQELPEGMDPNLLDLFLSLRDKTYGVLQAQEFAGDLLSFYHLRKNIKIALRNLDAYEQRISAIRVTSELVRAVIGEKGGKPLSDDMVKFVEGEVNDILDEEEEYIDECRQSLQLQLNCEASSDVSPGVLTDALSSVTKSDLSQDKGKSRAKYRYYEPVRHRLMSLGFIVSPPGTALGAVFPESDWIRDIPLQKQFWSEVKARTDTLVLRYRLLGDDKSALTRLLTPPKTVPSDLPLSDGLKGWEKEWSTVCTAFVSAVGCLCVSWTRHMDKGAPVYVPILGLSGVVREEPRAPYFEKLCRHLALPSWEPDPVIPAPQLGEYTPSERIREMRRSLQAEATELFRKAKKPNKGASDAPPTEEELRIKSEREKFEARKTMVNTQDESAKARHNARRDREQLEAGLWVNYETMIRRSNLAAVGYRIRTLCELRRPARQALLSYASFRERKAHESLLIEKLQDRVDTTTGLHQPIGVDLWICGWHSLNCAEPAALMTASSFFCDGCDVLVCFPYEGFNDTGPYRNRPKETCPWCAAVELGFRSLTHNRGQVDTSKNTGVWATQLTITTMTEPEKVLSTKKGFDAFSGDNVIMRSKSTRATLDGVDSIPVKNSNLEDPAYSEVVETKIGRVRSMYHLLGLLDPKVIALDRPLFRYARDRLLGPWDPREDRWPRVRTKRGDKGKQRKGGGVDGLGLGGTGKSKGKTLPAAMICPSCGKKVEKPNSAACDTCIEKTMEVWSENTESRIKARILYDSYLKTNYRLTPNPGGGDCMYYAFADGIRRRTRLDTEKIPEVDRFEESLLYREGGAAMTANLIRRGVGVSPVMFDEMPISPTARDTLNGVIASASDGVDRLRRAAWARIRTSFDLRDDYQFRDSDPLYPIYVRLVERHVITAIREDSNLVKSLATLADAYEQGQRKKNQWAGDLDYRGLVLAFRVNLRMHYVDPSPLGIMTRSGHRVEVYSFKDLSAQYFLADVPNALVTIDVFHVNDNHYVAGFR